VIRYGDRVCLATDPALRVDATTGFVGAPYFLCSEPADAILGHGRGKRQEVSFKTGPGKREAEWRVDGTSADRDIDTGLEVVAGKCFVLTHCATNIPLACLLSDRSVGEFGPELEVHAMSHQPVGIVEQGKARPAKEQNQFAFDLGTNRAAAADRRDLKPVTAEALIAMARHQMASRGTLSIRAIGKKFRIMDDGRDGKLSREDLKWGLFDQGVRFSDEEFDVLMAAYDHDGDGVVSYDEFLGALRGPMSGARVRAIDLAYDVLDRDGSGHVTMSDIAGHYDASMMPEVREGKMTEEEALKGFMSQWDTHTADGVVTREEFRTYFEDVSASVDDDTYFLDMVERAWKVDTDGDGDVEGTVLRNRDGDLVGAAQGGGGGGGPKKGSGSEGEEEEEVPLPPGVADIAGRMGPIPAGGLRVLVTFKTGRHKVIDVPGASGLKGDRRGLIDLLDDMGLPGVYKVRAL